MKILLVSKFYYRRGGAEIHVLELEKALKRRGHDVAILTMAYPKNEKTESQLYCVTEVKPFGTLKDKIKSALRLAGGFNARRKAIEVLQDFRPDVVHLHNVHSYLSPVIAVEAYKRGIKVVWTLHDYKLICPAYSFLRKGKLCKECKEGKYNALKNRCIKGSVLSSFGGWIEACIWNKKKLENVVSVFICPSQFMAEKMKEYGFSDYKLKVLRNFYSGERLNSNKDIRNGVVYAGRLSEEKGVEYLLEAAKKGQWNLIIAGDGPSSNLLRDRYSYCKNIRFAGMLNKEDVLELINSAKLSVMPSVCYENSPLSVIESLCCGTPVAVSAIGGIPELLEAEDGCAFEPRSSSSIIEAVDNILQTAYDHDAISRRALERFSVNKYIDSLEAIYIN